MSVNTLAISLRAKTDAIPLNWWKRLMVCKALAAPVIGGIALWILMELTPTAPINLGNRTDQITLIGLSLFIAAFAGLSAYTWQQYRRENRFFWTVSILLSASTGGFASGVIFQLVHSYTYVY